VDSAVARLVPDATRAVRISDATAYDRVVTRAFSMRRKRLGNALKGLLSEAEIRSCGVDPDLRPGEITPDGYMSLAGQLAKAD
jgi:16S rRNA (adenine1518-N6/adenine1519-N6)-dimethyltransferase